MSGDLTTSAADLPDFPTLEARVRFAMALEPDERAKAQERLRTQTKYTGPARRGVVMAVVAHRVGMSEVVYYRARTIVRAADDDTSPIIVREAARRELARMNLTGTVTGPYLALRRVLPGAKSTGRPKAEPRKPARPTRRKPVLDRFEAAVYDLDRLVLTLESVLADDRWPEHRDKVSSAVRADLRRAAAKLNTINEQVPQPSTPEGTPTP